MIKSHELLRELDERHERMRLRRMTYPEALERFNDLLDLARATGSMNHDDWLANLEPDLRIARALNALTTED